MLDTVELLLNLRIFNDLCLQPQNVGEGYRDVYHHQHQDEDRAGVRRAPSFAERIREAETRPAARVRVRGPSHSNKTFSFSAADRRWSPVELHQP